MLHKYKSVRKIPNIIEHHKYDMPDLHWDTRLTDAGTEYSALLDEYIEIYGDKNIYKLTEHIKKIMDTAVEEGAYVAFPLCIEHPMHMLVTCICVNMIKKLDFDRKKVIIYVDHPYDYQNAGTGRLQKAENYIRAELQRNLKRCDDLSIDQSILEKIIAEIYGERHYGEFDGSLANTFCSYFIDQMALAEVGEFLDIHVNNILYITAQAKPYYKTGGLGEVAYVYCKALKDFVNDVRIMMPKYSGEDIRTDIDDSREETFHFKYRGNTRDIGNIACSIDKRQYRDLIYYLVDIKDYFAGRNRFDSGNHGKVFAVFCDTILQ
ncbi:MAG: glycogen/starch synthase, partial [Acetatifactor sp.]|nr:glycogen/starch synthase [Acetatifactor sp.]